MYFYKALCLLLFMNVLSLSNAQTNNAESPFQLNWKKESAFIGTAVTTIGLGAYLRNQTPLYTASEIQNLNPENINAFDRNTVNNFSLSAHSSSDVFWYGSFSSPLWFLAGKKTRKDFGGIMALWGETAFINAGLTLLTKYSVRRTRPFVYNSEAPMDKKLAPNAKGSFFSGHTSMTAANTFFAAKIFSEYYPESKLKPVVWGVAASIPAITGYLRVKGGRHFPTDVITGYAVGAAVGYLVPHLHKKKTVRGLSFYGGYNSAGLNWNF